jgi:GlcNAc-P-P-Und epimerase
VVDVRDRDALAAAVRGGRAIVNLAAEHRDDVSPRSLYDEVNVGGAVNVCDAARSNGIDRIVFTSSVAVYGFTSKETDETGIIKPFNDYGRTKAEAEAVYRDWLAEDPIRRSLVIVRPTVVFGERNRGNVYNLLRQATRNGSIMIGSGRNRKSLAYVCNISAFLEHSLGLPSGEHVFNYVDKPDFDMNSLTALIRSLSHHSNGLKIRVPYWIAHSGAGVLDVIGQAARVRFPISAIRVKKFCSETWFSSSRIGLTGFAAPVSLQDALERTVRYEFFERHDEEPFYTE